MKKIIIITLTAITTLTMLFSFLPVSTALAKKNDTNVTLKVRNRTGGKVAVMLIDENGNHLFSSMGRAKPTRLSSKVISATMPAPPAAIRVAYST
jgi:hypothetical protein